MARTLRSPATPIGVSKGLRFVLDWTGPSRGTAAEVTTGTLHLEVDERPLWGLADDGFVWSWIELLEHLAEHWSALTLEESSPLGLDAVLDAIRPAARVRWRALADQSQIEREQRDLFRYEHAHNLALAIGGVALPALWIGRAGNDAVLRMPPHEVRRPFFEVHQTLAALGDEIAARAHLVAERDLRARSAVTAWQARGAATPAAIRLATGLADSVIAAVQGRRSLANTWGLGSGPATLSSELVAARMIGNTGSTSTLRTVVQWIGRCTPPSPRQIDRINEWSRTAERFATQVARQEHRRFAQGHELALWFRSLPGVVGTSQRVDPERLLREVGVAVDEDDLDESIDAVACWSSDRGPAILINPRGKHSQGAEGRRATLAHELCHLLIDRRHSLPFAEVLGGKTPLAVEQRASAFAAELLLPRAIAGKTLQEAVDPERCVKQLRRDFGVSRAIIAWQAVRSGLGLRKEVRRHLRALVDEPEKFDQAAD